MDAKDPDARCRVTIGFRPDGDASVTGDATATCQGGVDYNPERDAIFSGGVGTQIGHVRFRRKYNLGPVTVELNDPDSFFAGSGLLETKRCNDLAQPSG